VPSWIEHDEIFAIPDVSEACDAMQPRISWRIFQFGSHCNKECQKIRKRRRTDWPQIVAIMQKLSVAGTIRNEDQFKHEFDDIYAIKSRRGIRALGKLENRGLAGSLPVFVVLNWFQKRRQSLNKDEVKRARSRREEFEQFVLEHGNEN
tara:strand:+ start:37 stop:483 length:447 start_codon:yes stop_codon:yes gene_type:complete